MAFRLASATLGQTMSIVSMSAEVEMGVRTVGFLGDRREGVVVSVERRHQGGQLHPAVAH